MQRQSCVLDTLVYLFDFLVQEKKTQFSVKEVHDKLTAVGFNADDIQSALIWLGELKDYQGDSGIQSPSRHAYRLYCAEECEKVTQSGRACLDELVAMKVISTRLREVIITKLMSIDNVAVTDQGIMWVALMAIHSTKGQEGNALWLQRSLYESNEPVVIH